MSWAPSSAARLCSTQDLLKGFLVRDLRCWLTGTLACILLTTVPSVGSGQSVFRGDRDDQAAALHDIVGVAQLDPQTLILGTLGSGVFGGRWRFRLIDLPRAIPMGTPRYLSFNATKLALWPQDSKEPI